MFKKQNKDRHEPKGSRLDKGHGLYKDLGLAWDQLFLRPKVHQPQSHLALPDWSVPWPGFPSLSICRI